MENGLQVFTNEQFGQIRVIDQNGEPWFAGADIAKALGYGNTKDAIAVHVEDEDKRLVLRSEIATLENHIPKEVFPVEFVNGNIPNRGLVFINESGVYSLILRSKLPAAKQFKHWVTSEVLPSIRKHDVYATPEMVEKTLQDPDTIIRILQEIKKERDLRVKAEEQIRLDAPKVLFADCVSQADTDILVGELAKLLKQNGMDIGQNRLYEKLRAEGFIMKNSTIPTQRAMEMGLFRVIERSIMQPNGTTRITQTTKVTGKGQQYFVNRYIGREC